MNTKQTTETADASQNCVIKIDPKFKLEKVVSKDPTRKVLNYVKLDASTRFGQCAVATNGRTMAIVPVEFDQESAPNDKGLISVEALKDSRKGKGWHNGRLTLNGSIEVLDKTYKRPTTAEHRFPNWEVVLPDKKTTFTVGLDAKLLFELAQALGSDGAVTLDFSDELSPISVRCGGYHADQSAFGVLMPMRVS